MNITTISDLHGETPDLESGDLLIIAGDLTAMDKPHQYVKFGKWLKKQDYEKIILIAGNHDVRLSHANSINDLFDCPNNVDYLCDSGTEYKGLKIWGAPWTPWFYGINPDCAAFTLKNRSQLAEKWALIPDDTNILVTHGPPFGMLDKNKRSTRCGCYALSDRVLQLKNLKLHVFGHIHEGYGECHQAYKEITEAINNEPNAIGHLSINCAHMNRDYEPINKPINIYLC